MGEEGENIKTKENPNSNDDSESKCSMKLLEPDHPEQDADNANDRIPTPKTLKSSPQEAAPREESVSVFDIKKKMLDNWSKSRKDLSPESESEYQHKKIRKASHEKYGYKDPEPLRSISDDET